MDVDIPAQGIDFLRQLSLGDARWASAESVHGSSRQHSAGLAWPEFGRKRSKSAWWRSLTQVASSTNEGRWRNQYGVTRDRRRTKQWARRHRLPGSRTRL